MKNHKHLTLEDRLIIENGINSNKSCKEIASYINKSESTIRREIINNRHLVTPNLFNNTTPRTCSCSNLFPYVCNNCKRGRSGKKDFQYFYAASIAQGSYEKRYSLSRSNPHFNETEITYIDHKIKEGLKNNQPLNHIIHTHKLPISVSTGYRWIQTKVISSKTIDLQKAVAYKIDSTDKIRRSAENKNREGRTYIEYLEFISNNPELNMIEMDIVEGLRSDKKCILTFVCIKANLLFSKLLNFQNKENVIKAFNTLELELGIETFKLFFGVILTDNGSEFNDVEALEFSPYTKERRTRVFYCDPRRSDQKGTIERKHADMRLIIPKKKSIDFLTQEKVDLMNSHINGILRPTLNNQSTYDFALFLHSKKLIRTLGLTKINPEDIILSPNLFKQ